MAGDLENNVISKKNTGFPPYLDYPKLRSEAIAYLGKLSGKLWTDHNMHDPGITLLETLLYGMMDLGYRTNLPVKDLFARDPQEKGNDNNFFSPSRILANNPLTITDYRKLLVDISGVKNAWLEPDTTTSVVFCKPKPQPIPGSIANNTEKTLKGPCECDFINGLYHVYLQLEKDPYNPGTPGSYPNKHWESAILSKVKKSLMAHRNLCEDFIDIRVLCSFEIGICGEFELNEDANVEDVYLRLNSVLREYFSPSPRYYSFEQLLNKGRTIDEIYAGRPYNITESHGFIDTDEFEKLVLRKSLHLSDVYQLLQSVEGIAEVKNVGWIKCCDGNKAEHTWVLQLPPDHVPEFSPSCSGFKFTRRRLPVATDPEKFANLLKLNITTSHKGLYKVPSDYLEPAFPKGVFRPELDQYRSIQHELPRVYGIADGALPPTAPVKRVAQARQLQGFLLFFDQLLANYLSQLKNIRSLFSLSTSDKTKKHTYFLNELKDIPHFSELTRFSSGNIQKGNEGSALAYPASRKKFEELMDEGRLEGSGPNRRCNGKYINDFPEYAFCYAKDRDQAVLQLQEDLKYDEFHPEIVSDNNGCHYFYLFTSSPDFVLVSKRFYGSAQEAKVAAASLLYAASFPENIHTFVHESGMKESFSFGIDLNLNTYVNYLERIAEDENGYTTRRQQFLDHLLARFAESFTDYALLTAGVSENRQPSVEIGVKEKFLKHYEDISSNRGKAHDYRVDGWNNHNIPGFEKRFKGITGITNWKKHYLCNFIVEPAEAEYYLLIKLFNEVFSVPYETFSKKAAYDSLFSIYSRLGNEPQFHTSWDSSLLKYHVVIADYQGNTYQSAKTFATPEDAESWVQRLEKALDFVPNTGKDIRPASYIRHALIRNFEGRNIAEGIQPLKEENAVNYVSKLEKQLSEKLADPKIFKLLTGEPIPHHLVILSRDDQKEITYFINEDDFECKLSNEYKLEKDGKRFTLLNVNVRLQFNGLIVHDKAAEAKEDCTKVLLSLNDIDNYSVEEDLDEKVWKVFIKRENSNVAIYHETFETEAKGWQKVEDLIRIINGYTYRLEISDPIPDAYEFLYTAADLGGNSIIYTSEQKYKSEAAAVKAALEFYASTPLLEVSEAGDRIILKKSGPKREVTASNAEGEFQLAEKLLAFQKEAYVTTHDISAEKIEMLLEENRRNPKEDYIYKLVDKDHPVAIHPGVFKNKANAESAMAQLAASLRVYDLMDIALGGDIVHERKDLVKRKTYYHYQVKATNKFYTKGKLKDTPLVLFESVRGYTSREEAIRLFEQSLPLILRKAIQESNYGKDRFISQEVSYLDSTDPCITTRSTLFIPKETAEEFSPAYEIQREIILLIKSYPIRVYGKKRLRFVVGRIDTGVEKVFVEEWRSVERFQTIRDALKGLEFFFILTKYKGNLVVIEDEMSCVFRIYLREVLAVSAYGFDSPEKAWGSEGVEKFIGVSQSAGGFHNYWNSYRCGYSFFVACGHMGLQHPCIYETSRRRNDMMDRLLRAAQSFRFEDLVINIADNLIILDDKLIDPCVDPSSPPLVSISVKDLKKSKVSLCELLVSFKESVAFDDNYIKDNGKLFLVATEPGGIKRRIAEPQDPKISLKQWKRRLIKLARYIPVFRLNDKYYVSIHLPGFEDTSQGIEITDPCGCTDAPNDCTITCGVTWKSDCCFDTCCKAFEFYVYSYELLIRAENYKPVFDCECSSYRIEINPTLSPTTKKLLALSSLKSMSIIEKLCGEKDYYGSLSEGITYFKSKTGDCLAGIIAINPQTYVTEKSTCAAVERSRELINSEGLHLLEHILLRPRCKNADGVYEECNCPGLSMTCTPQKLEEICHFKWIPGNDVDPCEEETGTTCFTPGCDPYSFIATVALPAWPQKYRSPEAKKIIEKILQREAPAHIMLRILWLNPRDFCCFEKYYKTWHEWLANKLCKKYSSCDFLSFLFGKKFPEWEYQPVCIPCDSNNPNKDCSIGNEDLKDPCADHSIKYLIDKVYCWGESDIIPSYSPCEPWLQMPSLANEKKLSKDQIRKLTARHTRYKTMVGELDEPEFLKKAITDAGIFLTNTSANVERFDHIIHEIVDASNQLNEAQIKLMSVCAWKFLDLACLEKQPEKMITEAKHVFYFMKQNAVGIDELYDGWNAEEMKSISPFADINNIKKIIA